ncbi:MAG: MarR family winged helix-turn-helix transcriptional regulator [Coriobacteriales bacterium]
MATNTLSIGSRLSWINYFIKLNNAVDSNIKKACKLNITQARILLYLATHESMPIGDVGRAIFLKASTITASADRLFDDGYITRSYDDVDRRHVFIEITDAGREVVKEYVSAVYKAFEEDCAPAAEEKRPELRKLMMPASSKSFFGSEVSLEEAAKVLGSSLKLDKSAKELEDDATRVLVIESINCYLAKLTIFERGFDLTLNEARILRTLGNDNRGTRLKDLSASINIRPNVASLAIRTLTDRNLINRPCNPKDRRAANVTLSRKGSRMLHDSKGDYCELFDACYPALESHEITEFFPEQ